MTTIQTTAERIAAEGIRHDRYGFPLTECSRCGGTGTYPSPWYQGKCLLCGGSGWKIYNASAKRQRDRFLAASRVARPLAEVAVGDRVFMHYGTLGNVEAAARVEDVKVEQGDFGSSRSGDDITVHDARLVLTTVHGRLGRSSCSWPFNIEKGLSATIPCPVDVDPAPFIAKIKL